LEDELKEYMDNPRHASVWAVAIAGALTEKIFKKEDLVEFAVKLSKNEFEAAKSEGTLGLLWESIDILHKRDKIDVQILKKDTGEMASDNILILHLPLLLGEIRANPNTRYYGDRLPNHREVAKLLKQEPYVIVQKNVNIEGKVAHRWILDLSKCPEILQNTFDADSFDRKEMEKNEEL
jgi:hypothetical protein